MIKIIRKLFNKLREYVNKNVHNLLSTISNFAYILIGYIRLATNPFIGFLLILLGIASTGFHWTRTKAWNDFDIIAIFYVFSTIAGWLWLGTIGMGIGLILGFIGQLLYLKFDVKGKIIIGVFGILCLIPYYILTGFWSSMNVIFWFGMALLVSYIADHFDPEQDGKVYDTLHAVWHIFSAIGIFHLTNLTGPVGIFLL